MAKSKNDDRSGGMPARTIDAAFSEVVDAWRNYQQAAGGPFEQNAHEQLHFSVAAYYKVLRPLVSSSNSTDDLWKNEELWPTEPVRVEIGLCPECGANESLDALNDSGISLGDVCPNCGDGAVERAQAPKTDEDGQVVYHHVEGLESVQGIWDQRVEQKIEYEDALGSHTETVVETQLLDPAHLQKISEKLDEAMERLDLHAPVNDEVPTTELDNEDLEKFGEQLQQIREKWGDEGGLDESEVSDS
jgi:predicted RNA-binding Zn-ribbon protein involved in translation (DUF1610 family)